MGEDNRRRQYWINPTFQKRFVRAMLYLELFGVVAAAGVAGLGWLFLVFVNYFDFHWIVYVLILTIFTSLVASAVAYVTIHTSHRICGPIFRVMEHLKMIQEGMDPPPIQTRENDYFQDLVEAVNDTLSMFEKLKSKRTFDQADTSAPPKV